MGKLIEEVEISIEVIEESGYKSSKCGIALNKDQPFSEMDRVALILSDLDNGHNKFLEQIIVWMVIRAPRYWWQEADTFRLSSKSSQSTMHTILKNKLTKFNFECPDMEDDYLLFLNGLLAEKNLIRLKRKLPEGFMQKRMWMMSYKTLRNIIIQRRSHRLPHWQIYIKSILSQIKNPELLPGLGK